MNKNKSDLSQTVLLVYCNNHIYLQLNTNNHRPFELSSASRLAMRACFTQRIENGVTHGSSDFN